MTLFSVIDAYVPYKIHVIYNDNIVKFYHVCTLVVHRTPTIK